MTRGFQVMTPDVQSLLQYVDTIGTAVQVLGIIIGIPLVLRQIRLQTKATILQSDNLQFSNYMQLMSESARINDKFYEDSELFDFYNNDNVPTNLSNDWHSLDATYRKYYFYLARLMSVMEQSYFCFNKGWIDSIDYRAIITHLQEIMGLKIFSHWWDNLKPFYRDDFRRYIDNLRNKDNKTFLQLAMEKNLLFSNKKY